ncbi:MAG TPA: DUF3078 domain-containing protein [Crocinitomicaceae bacterium]|nr:DUF3078 domain-containing protein [Crocinitomicaceae bacterium]
MKNLILATITLCLFSVSFAQTDSVPAPVDPNWKLQSIYGLNGTQSSFVNWNAGGRNNISILGYISATANYKKNTLKWDNSLDLALGGIQYIGVGAPKQLQKTDDKIDFSTNVGLRMKEHWYYSLLGSFKTQFLDGYSYPNDSIRVSGMMAPGYATIALGVEYKPNDNFMMFISPLASKMTFVQIQHLADAGAFGVDKAEYDLLGNVISNGKRFRGEFGAYFKMTYNKDLAKNINLKTKLELFSNYANNPQNIDVNADVLFSFKINNWMSASLNWTLIYDDDIDIRDVKGNVGPRTQFKSVLGLGVSYTMRNFTVKK